MTTVVENYIAGRKKPVDWYSLRDRLAPHDAAAWSEAFRDYFRERLTLRYLDPIRVLQDNGALRGEGFSILTVQCSLLEFLESTRQGKTFRRPTKGQPVGPYEYSDSSDVFVTFLSQRTPFANTFDQTSAEDFYVNVRCALLHEARTKGGWRIRANGPPHLVANIHDRKVFRNNFQTALLAYIDAYYHELFGSPDLQAAFIRKFDSLCT